MRLVITGIGIISALGMGREQNEERLLRGESGIGAPEVLGTCHKEWPMGEVGLTNAQLKMLLRQSPDAQISRNALLGMLAAREAADDAGLTPEQLQHTTLLNGTTVGGMDLTEKWADHWYRGDYEQLDAIHQHEAHATTRMIGALLGGVKEAVTVSTACSSALNALISGCNRLRIGVADRVLVGGTEALTRFHLNGFAALGILSTERCRPFSPDRDGINLGEGAAYLVIEKEEDALARGAKIYGYVGGYGNRCDAYHQTASSAEGQGAWLAMQDALRMGGIAPEAIEYINAHGTATPNNDASEAAAIERLFGRPFDGKHWPAPLSTKDLTGHTTSASGSIEAAFCLMLMKARGYQHVLTNAFGFGGNDSALVLSATPIDLPKRTQQGEIGLTHPVVVNEDVDTKAYIPPMQARRMNGQMRRLVVAARQCLEQAGLDRPDAIIVGTRWGGMSPSAALLKGLVEQGEHDFSPSLFMQSTHNTPASTLAIQLGCHGYNSTFSCGEDSLEQALADAALVMLTTEAQNVLVCAFDEEVDGWQTLLTEAGMPAQNTARAQLLVRKKTI